MESTLDLAPSSVRVRNVLRRPAAIRSRAENTVRAPAESVPRRSTRPALTGRPASYQLQLDAREHRSFTLGAIVGAIVGSIVEAAIASARRAYARYRQWRRAAAVYNALRNLDDHTLRDLGFDRSEIRSLAAEFAGEAESTRLRVLLTNPGRW
jgi:uncharacterized protein YjiS (DUF1127 family)